MRYAISDIHGCLKTLRALVELQLQLNKETDVLYVLGDYIDRGNDSKGVIDYLMLLQAEGYKVECLRGNHEQLLLESLEDRDTLSTWLNAGGMQTLASFDVRHPREIPDIYVEWMRDLPYYFTLPDYYLVHAGFNFEDDSDFLTNTIAMIWIRRWQSSIKPELLGGRIIVHGHTPNTRALITASAAALGHSLDIDAGCFSKTEGYGHLCAFNLDTQQVVFQERLDY